LILYLLFTVMLYNFFIQQKVETQKKYSIFTHRWGQWQNAL